MKTTSLASACLAATLFIAPHVWAVDPTPSASPSSDDAAAKAARHAEWVKRFDKDGDGKLSDAERADAKAQMQNQNAGRHKRLREHAVKRFDKDGDGKLNEEERKAAADAMFSRPNVIKKFDKDGDGKLNEAERAEAMKALQDHQKAKGSE
jgi:Ca2+-binding EF-hand superfamily protein